MKPYYENENGKLYCGDFLQNKLSDKSQQLIIADPPYYKIKGEFDFKWKTFEEYLIDVDLWAKECQRVLSSNGTVIWYGSSKKIAYSQIILDKYFNLINNAVWDKGSFMGLEKSNDLRSLAPCTERILFYGSKEQGLTGLEFIEKEYIAPRNPFSIGLKKARLKKGVSINEVAEYGHFYGNVNHGGSVTNWERGYSIPNPEQWRILCLNLPIEQIEYNILLQEYEGLRREYEGLRRAWGNKYNLQEVLRFKNEQVSTGSKYDHDTVKPEHLTRALIETTTNKSTNVLVPFVGSGTECFVSEELNMKWTGFEISEKYCLIAAKRIEAENKQLKMF